MFKKAAAVLLLSLLSAGMLFAEPLVLEKAANVLEPKTMEVGLGDIEYQNDITEITDTAGTTIYKLTGTVVVMPLSLRYAFTNNWEGSLRLPYTSSSLKTESAGTSTTSNTSGLADPNVRIKYNFLNTNLKLGAAANLSLPVGSSDFRQGLNIAPMICASRELGKFVCNANLSYELRSEYESNNAAKTKIMLGNVLSLGVGAEYLIRNINVLGELVYQNVSESKIAGVAQAGSAGSLVDVNLGMRYTKGNLKTKFGVALAMGEEKYRKYDYKVLAGVTYCIGI